MHEVGRVVDRYVRLLHLVLYVAGVYGRRVICVLGRYGCLYVASGLPELRQFEHLAGVRHHLHVVYVVVVVMGEAEVYVLLQRLVINGR